MVAAVLETVNQMLDAAVASGKTGADVLVQMTAMASTVQVSFVAQVVAVAEQMAAAEAAGTTYDVAAAVGDIASNFSPEAIQAEVSAFLPSPPPSSPLPAKGGAAERSPTAYIAASASGALLAAAAAAVYVRRRKAISPAREGAPPPKKRGSGSPMLMRSSTSLSNVATAPTDAEAGFAGGASPKRAQAPKCARPVTKSHVICWLPLPPFIRFAADSFSSRSSASIRGGAPHHPAMAPSPSPDGAAQGASTPPAAPALRAAAAPTAAAPLAAAPFAAAPTAAAPLAAAPLAAALPFGTDLHGRIALAPSNSRSRASLKRGRSAKRDPVRWRTNEAAATSSFSVVAALSSMQAPVNFPETPMFPQIDGSPALVCDAAVRRVLGDLPALPALRRAAASPGLQADEVRLLFDSYTLTITSTPPSLH